MTATADDPVTALAENYTALLARFGPLLDRAIPAELTLHLPASRWPETFPSLRVISTPSAPILERETCRHCGTNGWRPNRRAGRPRVNYDCVECSRRRTRRNNERRKVGAK